MNHSPGGGRLVVTSAGELAFLAGAACAAGDEVFLNYFDGQEASTPERVLAHYGFEPGAVAEPAAAATAAAKPVAAPA